VTSPVSLLPPMAGGSFPAPAISGLSDDEQRLVTGLSTKLAFLSAPMMLRDSYYNGTQRLADLGVAIPQQLAGVRTVVDWPRITVDALVERCVVDGFRMPGATDVDDEMASLWQSSDLDGEALLCFLDSLIFGRGYMVVGSGDSEGDLPLITVESPLNLSMTWDPRTRKPTAAYQAYEVDGVYQSVLYLPDETIRMSRDGAQGAWAIDDRDQHGFGQVPVVRFPNRQRSANREGASEITPAIMNTTDSACRSLLGMEIAREFYSVPHRYVLGASEADFVDSSGNAKTAIQMAMNKFVAFERDEEGNTPSVGQFTAYDPSVFTRIIDEHAQLMSSYTGFPPSYFGLTSTANPASADAIRVSENRLVKRAERAQMEFSSRLEDVMRLAWRFANSGAPVPAGMQRLETDWEPAATPTPAGTTDAITKQIAAGSIPATSDVTLRRLGYSAVDRARLETDRKLDQGAHVLAELATSLGAKQARVNSTIASTINPQAAKIPPTNVQPAVPPSG
jgi:hypothetical protein